MIFVEQLVNSLSTAIPSWQSMEIEAAGAELGGAVATGGANAGRNSGRKRPLAGRPDRPEAASRRDLSEKAVAGRSQ